MILELSLFNASIMSIIYIQLTISSLIDRKRTVNFETAPGTSFSCRLYNNHVNDTEVHG